MNQGDLCYDGGMRMLLLGAKSKAASSVEVVSKNSQGEESTVWKIVRVGVAAMENAQAHSAGMEQKQLTGAGDRLGPTGKSMPPPSLLPPHAHTHPYLFAHLNN